MIFTKVVDISDPIGDIARLELAKSDGERIAAVLSREQLFYFKARLTDICDKLSAKEGRMS